MHAHRHTQATDRRQNKTLLYSVLIQHLHATWLPALCFWFGCSLLQVNKARVSRPSGIVCFHNCAHVRITGSIKQTWSWFWSRMFSLLQTFELLLIKTNLLSCDCHIATATRVSLRQKPPPSPSQGIVYDSQGCLSCSGT